MVNQEHIDRLKRGVVRWNQWRNISPQILPDLNGVDLKEVDLIGADLSKAYLIKADLSNASLTAANLTKAHLAGANLIGADLRGADFTAANLIGADLRGADFTAANLIGADLRGADLTTANLTGANLFNTALDGANLSNADLTGSAFASTILVNLDLSSTKGLFEIKHSGPSIIQLHTVQLPQDGSALHFLRGVGVPDEWIDFYRTSMMQPIHYHSVFISYASENGDIAKRLHADLQANGVRCWFAPHDLRPGSWFRQEIDNAIHVQDKLLLILSEQSVKSKWVKYEVNRARDREVNQDRTILFPIRIDDTVLHARDDWAHDLRTHRHIGDFTGWQEHQRYQEAFTQFLKYLRDETK